MCVMPCLARTSRMLAVSGTKTAFVRLATRATATQLDSTHINSSPFLSSHTFAGRCTMLTEDVWLTDARASMDSFLSDRLGKCSSIPRRGGRTWTRCIRCAISRTERLSFARMMVRKVFHAVAGRGNATEVTASQSHSTPLLCDTQYRHKQCRYQVTVEVLLRRFQAR